MKEYTKKQYALSYAKMGFKIFPLTPRSKLPATKHGFKNSTTDIDTIKNWWNKNPEYNIGLATGNGLLVIDLDVDDEKDINGYEELRKWEQEHGELPDTCRTITGRGGNHLLFKVDENLGNRTGVIEGIDIRADGGYIVMPPSVHENGNLYEWEQSPDEFEIAKANDSVLELVKYKTNSTEKLHIGPIIKAGERNTTLFRLASSLQTRGLSDEAIQGALQAENNIKCNPPLDDDEIEKIIKSVSKYEKGPSNKNVVSDSKEEDNKFFLVFRNQQKPENGLKVNVSLLAMYMKQKHDIKIYKGQLRLKTNNYYAHIENIKGLISAEIPEQYRLPANIRDCEELLVIDNSLTLNDEEIAEEQYISFKNGVLNTETMEFKKHDDPLTHDLIFINQVGCNWNPEAKADHITDLFFNSTTGGKQSDIDYLYQILGVLISGYRSFKNIFYFTGAKDTGKSRYLALAERLLTNPDASRDFSNIGLKVLTDETSKEFSRIIGKRANISAETPDIRITNDTLLKQLSGGDNCNAQIKFKESVDFKNKAMLIFSGNTIPKFFISDKSSIGERLLIYKFKTRIEKKDQIKEIEQKMDLEYVALKAVEQLQKFIKNNQEFSVPEEIEQHREEMLQDSDTIYKFYKTRTMTTNDDKDRISNKDLYRAFLNFLLEEGFVQETWDGKPDMKDVKVTQYVFTAQVKKHHGEDKHKRNVSYMRTKADCFMYIKLKGREEPTLGEQKENFKQSRIVNLY